MDSTACITDFEPLLNHIAPYAYKLKCWLTIQNSSNSSYDSLSSENWSESDVESKKKDSGNFSIEFKNQIYFATLKHGGKIS